jgi:hypothetical protein
LPYTSCFRIGKSSLILSASKESILVGSSEAKIPPVAFMVPPQRESYYGLRK